LYYDSVFKIILIDIKIILNHIKKILFITLFKMLKIILNKLPNIIMSQALIKNIKTLQIILLNERVEEYVNNYKKIIEYLEYIVSINE